MKSIYSKFESKISFLKDIDDYSQSLFKKINKKSFLVIGGAGTIGSNYIKQVLKYKPSKITVVDIDENGLAELTRDLRSSNLLDYNPDFKTYPVNLLSDTFDKLFKSHKWQIVSNFSAHKHVRSEKDIISIEALIKNNVYGAIKIINLCELNPPQFFFSVSTDKATNPVNIMGASKSLMEKIIISKKNNFRVSSARFANVAFSNGSLMYGWTQRLLKKQPLSCPIDIKRFFVTPEQSGQICLLATFLGDSGNIFFPKLDLVNDQMYFKNLVVDFLKNNGYEPEFIFSEKKAKTFNLSNVSKKYPVHVFKTNTSGEKNFEEFFDKSENYELDKFNSLGVINKKIKKIDYNDIKKSFDKLFINSNSNKSDIVDLIKNLVPDFNHIETGKNLDQKM